MHWYLWKLPCPVRTYVRWKEMPPGSVRQFIHPDRVELLRWSIRRLLQPLATSGSLPDGHLSVIGSCAPEVANHLQPLAPLSANKRQTMPPRPGKFWVLSQGQRFPTSCCLTSTLTISVNRYYYYLLTPILLIFSLCFLYIFYLFLFTGRLSHLFWGPSPLPGHGHFYVSLGSNPMAFMPLWAVPIQVVGLPCHIFTRFQFQALCSLLFFYSFISSSFFLNSLLRFFSFHLYGIMINLHYNQISRY